MAVYTPVSEDQLRSFLKNYDLGDLQSFEGIESGVSNSNYHVYTDQGRYILTLFEERRTDINALPFFFSFAMHLKNKGINCPCPLSDHEGKLFSTLAEKPAAFVTFLEGQEVAPATITPGICAQVGKMVARMHVGAEGFKMKRPNSMGMAAWKELAAQTADQADAVEAGLRELIADELRYLEQNGLHDLQGDLPQAAIHADIFRDNVFFKDGKIHAVIDFTFSCTDFLAFDLAIVINAWCFDDDCVFQPDFFKALIEGYELVRPLTDSEKENLSLLCRGAAMRILSTRLYDWVFHDPDDFVQPHDPREYLKKIRFHQNEQILLR